MKRGALVLVLAVLLCAAGFFVVRWGMLQRAHGHLVGHEYAQHGPHARHHELDWLKADLGLDAGQLKKIEALHVAYHPVCEQLAHRLEVSHQKLDGITKTATSVSKDLEEALREHSDIHLECQHAMLKHFYETAACMKPDQSRRYLEKMLPLVFLHDAPGSLPHSH